MERKIAPEKGKPGIWIIPTDGIAAVFHSLGWQLKRALHKQLFYRIVRLNPAKHLSTLSSEVVLWK